MNEKDNIYILALEKGAECSDEGISYIEMTDYLVKKHVVAVTGSFNEYFKIWFFENFYLEKADVELRYKSTQAQTIEIKESLLYENAYIKGEAYINYLDYVELKEARQSSKQAKKIAIGAIIISGALAIASIGLSLHQIICG